METLSKSKNWCQDLSQPKKYTVFLRISENSSDILTYCTCKAGARTLGGCAHSCAILYHLTVDKCGERPNAAHKRVNLSGVVDIREFKLQKKQNTQENQSQIEELDDSIQS